MTDPQTQLVKLEGAGVRKGAEWLVRGVDLSVSPGEIITLIGPNGSGKSTTAKMALGILTPSEGRAVRVPGLKVGYVPQKLTIDWTLPLSVHRFLRLTNHLSVAECTKALEQTGAGRLLNAEMRNLSGGELQRVMLARAIARNPDLLVLDEPVQGVDYAGEIAIYDLISEIRSTMGCGILMISHDLHVVMAAADQVVCLNGHVCCRGTPSDVSKDANYQALFGARAGAALAVYEHHHDHVHLPDGQVRHADGTLCSACPGEHHDHVHDEPHKQTDLSNAG
ncbi:metal ABC transporter ATP-binding protein [Roseibium salinum]|uniref:Metal ABC transporter ATP-binding protein n=1 Tax=Roseibium salinum TaxID=1604349 RepID=A0ABT3R1R1_9HYPH|nr:metal ABC transporter ATP-binding protein [Roseibium sp. DSM 29163]MCX2723189.1 metal ABC transporter ATP-binding protein [Roseibium sp. DSM 29163]MDN3718895.1 metal ABC transporter ATP-binding protein [Roseibium salinum]